MDMLLFEVLFFCAVAFCVEHTACNEILGVYGILGSIFTQWGSPFLVFLHDHWATQWFHCPTKCFYHGTVSVHKSKCTKESYAVPQWTQSSL